MSTPLFTEKVEIKVCKIGFMVGTRGIKGDGFESKSKKNERIFACAVEEKNLIVRRWNEGGDWSKNLYAGAYNPDFDEEPSFGSEFCIYYVEYE